MADGHYYDLVMGLKKSLAVIVRTAGVGAGVFVALEGLQLPDTWEQVPAIGIGAGVPLLLGVVKFVCNYRKQTARWPWQG